jgi:hypothetical protein
MLSVMKCALATQQNAAFTLTEFVVLLLSVVLVFLMYLLVRPGGCHLKAKGPRVKCTGNLKQVALSYHLWCQDNEKDFPITLLASDGGTRDSALSGNIVPSYLIATNQMRTPSFLTCPADKKRKPVETFTKLTAANIGYFLNIDAAMTNQNQILAGDRNLAIAGSPVKPGPLQITNAADVQWANWLHAGGGNVALIDGSVHQVTSRGLRDLLTLGGPTNRLIIP